jgi:hypothetical protein
MLREDTAWILQTLDTATITQELPFGPLRWRIDDVLPPDVISNERRLQWQKARFPRTRYGAPVFPHRGAVFFGGREPPSDSFERAAPIDTYRRAPHRAQALVYKASDKFLHPETGTSVRFTRNPRNQWS